ncbi:cytidine deaminase, partial [Cooperia oncophora]
MGVSDEELIAKAREAMEHAYCPYSKFPVGAAILTSDDKVVVGVNCENASYGGTICAERSAILSAVSKGYRKFKAIAVVTELEEPGSPVRNVVQAILIEFGDCRVLMGSSKNDRVNVSSVVDLLPNAFSPAALDSHKEER